MEMMGKQRCILAHWKACSITIRNNSSQSDGAIRRNRYSHKQRAITRTRWRISIVLLNSEPVLNRRLWLVAWLASILFIGLWIAHSAVLSLIILVM